MSGTLLGAGVAAAVFSVLIALAVFGYASAKRRERNEWGEP